MEKKMETIDGVKYTNVADLQMMKDQAADQGVELEFRSASTEDERTATIIDAQKLADMSSALKAQRNDR